MRTNSNLARVCFISSFLLVLILVIGGCQSSGEAEDDKKWTEYEFGALTYKLPPGWVPVQRKDSIVYTKSGTPLHHIRIDRYENGDSYPYLNTPVDTGLGRFELAERSLMRLKSNPDYTRVELKRQHELKRLGKKGFLMKVRVMNTQGMNFLEWIAGGVKDGVYYRISVRAEEYGHYSKFRETFNKFIKRFKFKGEKLKEKK